jgi:hypothetical protein
MTRADKLLLYPIVAITIFVAISLLLVVSPHSQARRNQAKLFWLLADAHADSLPYQPIQRVSLGDGTALFPERDQVVVGYILRLHVRSTNYTIEAQPVKVGETGLLSYFRDEAGLIRFDISGKKANAQSRPMAQSLIDHAH